MQSYVLGFAFDANMRVVLIKKDRPEWMAGRWNGVGGKIEAGEAPMDAMVREFREETGVLTHPQIWQEYAILRDAAAGHTIHAFVAFVSVATLDSVKTMESEEIRIFGGDVLAIPDLNLMHNLRWLLPMSLCLADSEIPVEINFAFRYVDQQAIAA